MRRGCKKKLYDDNIYGILIIFGHWLDFFQMVFPSPMTNAETGETHVPMILYDFGVAAGICRIDHVCNRQGIEQSTIAGKESSVCKRKLIHHT